MDTTGLEKVPGYRRGHFTSIFNAALNPASSFVTIKYEKSPLRILYPMANKPPFAQGAQVEHPKFGLGSVLSCTEEYIVIKFDDHGEKKFVLSIVLPNLKKSDRQPPAEKRRAARKKTAPAA
jgi:hypothetical protein